MYCTRVLWACGRAVNVHAGSFRVHFYTFRPPAPSVRTGTADVERWLRRPRMVCAVREECGRAARHRFAISTFGDHRVAAVEGASRGEHRHFGLSPTNER